ncbi:unnamed protein product [Ixodes pacificus]
MCVPRPSVTTAYAKHRVRGFAYAAPLPLQSLFHISMHNRGLVRRGTSFIAASCHEVSPTKATWRLGLINRPSTLRELKAEKPHTRDETRRGPEPSCIDFVHPFHALRCTSASGCWRP